MREYVIYSLLGKQGALGNQLWEIAGTYGKARDAQTEPRFPTWYYNKFFTVPDRFFYDGPTPSGDDLGEDYLQDTSHWLPNYENEIRNLFRPSELATSLLNEIYPEVGFGDLTAVHVRRANNTTPRYAPYHPVCPIEFYESALELVSGPVMVFSDDLEWCRQQAVFEGAFFAQGPPDGVDVLDLTKYDPVPIDSAALDLLAMAKCRNHVISNSSFSWWGAFLAGGETVVYPERWYGHPLAHVDTTLMFEGLKGWHKMKFKDGWE